MRPPSAPEGSVTPEVTGDLPAPGKVPPPDPTASPLPAPTSPDAPGDPAAAPAAPADPEPGDPAGTAVGPAPANPAAPSHVPAGTAATPAELPGSAGSAAPAAEPPAATGKHATGKRARAKKAAGTETAGTETAPGTAAPDDENAAAPVAGPGPAATPEPVAEPHVRMDARALESALLNLRKRIAAVPLVFEAPNVAEAKAERVKLLSQIDDYLLPRLRRSAAPILVSLVGSTGSGKSTLVNSIVGMKVSATGVRLPTTNSPVLACHPDDVDWFAENNFLPSLPRVRQEGLARPGRDGLLVLAATEGMPKGLAVLDTPDIDSVVQAHHEFAYQFLDAVRPVAVRHLGQPVRGRAGLADASARQGPQSVARHRAVPRPGRGPGRAGRALHRDARRQRHQSAGPFRHPGDPPRRRHAPTGSVRADPRVADGHRPA